MRTEAAILRARELLAEGWTLPELMRSLNKAAVNDPELMRKAAAILTGALRTPKGSASSASMDG